MDRKTEKQSVYKRTLAYISNVILVFLFAIGLFVLVSILPIKNNFKLLAVLSGSMEPTIPTGALVVIKPATIYKVGDIIAFHPLNAKTTKEIVTHRIYAIKNTGGEDLYTTKGDANKAPDSESIPGDKIIGKHVATIALLGYLLGYIKTLPGLVLIIIIPATIIIYEEVNKIRREARQIIANRRKKKAADTKANAKKANIKKERRKK
jgi:signal peptidase